MAQSTFATFFPVENPNIVLGKKELFAPRERVDAWGYQFPNRPTHVRGIKTPAPV